MDNGEEIVPEQALHDLSRAGRGDDGVGTEDEQRANRRICHFAEERGAETVHVHGPTGRWAFVPVMDRLAIPLKVAARAVGQPASTSAVLSRECGEGADCPDVLATVTVAVDAVRDLDQSWLH